MFKLILLILLFPLFALGELTTPPKSVEQQFFQFKNQLSNPGAENGVTGWAASAGTFARTTTSGEFRNGAAGFSFDASATSQTVTGPTWTTKAATATNAAAMCYFATAATDYVMQVYDGTNVVVSTTIGASSTFTPLWLNFAAAASTGYRIRIVSASNAAEINWDDCYLGDAANLHEVSQASLWGTITWVGTAACDAWTVSNGSFTAIPADAGCNAPTVTGKLRAPATSIPGFITDWEPAHYMIVAQPYAGSGDIFQTARGTANSLVTGGFQFYDGTTQTESTTVQFSAASLSTTLLAYAPQITGTLNYTSATTNTAVGIRAYSSGSNTHSTSIPITSSVLGLTIKVYKFPTSSQVAYRSDLTDWFVAAEISGASPSLGTSAVTSYTEIIDSGLTLTPVSGSSPVGAMCSTTNAATAPTTSATTCAAGSESIGANFTIPFAGWYESCLDFGLYMQASSGIASTSTFQVIETPTNAQTLTQECGPKVGSTNLAQTIATGVNQGVGTPLKVCGQCYFASAGTKGVRLMYEQSVTGSPSAPLVLADASATNGQRVVRLTVRPLRYSLSAPQLVNSVIAPDYLGVTKINTVTSQSGNYTATVNDETIAFSAAATLSLPAAASVKGKKYTIDTFANFVTIDPNASETICGATTIKIGTNEVFSIQSDGTNWRPTGGSDCIRKDQGYLNCDAGAFFNTDKGTVASVGNRSTGCTATLVTGVCAGSGIATGSANENVTTADNINAYFSTATALLVTGRNNSGSATDFDAYVSMSCAR